MAVIAAHGHGVESHGAGHMSPEKRLRVNRVGLWLFFFSESIIFGLLFTSRFFLLGTHQEHVDQFLGLVITIVLLGIDRSLGGTGQPPKVYGRVPMSGTVTDIEVSLDQLQAIVVFESTYAQTSGMRSDFQAAIDRGAGLVIAHHPHVVHGVSTYGGRYVIGSLGNFVFDQEFYATWSSYLASVDLEQGANGVEVARLRLVPMHLDGFVPRLLTGVGVAELGRHVAQLGTAEQLAGGFTRALVFAEQGRLVVLPSEADALVSDLLDVRNVALSGGSTGPVSLAPYTDNDALAKLASSSAATCELGLDRMQYGDFEDRDVDDRAAEGDRWSQSSARYVQRKTVRSGEAAAVLLRTAGSASKASLTTLDRVPVTGGRKVSVTGWSKGDNAGKLEVQVRWKNSSGSTISTTVTTIKTGGTWNWTAFVINATAPASAASVELS